MAACKYGLNLAISRLPAILLAGLPVFFTSALSADQPTRPVEQLVEFHEVEFLEKNVRAAVQRATPATVGIGSGSGVVVSAEGLIFTVAHVANKVGGRLPVTFPDGRRSSAVILGRHESLDAAVCKLVGEGPFEFIKLADSNSVQLSDWVIAMGYPVSFEKGKQPAVRVGRIVQKQGQRNLVADCPIMGGDSGGPLLNLAGELVGIGSRCRDNPETNYFVPEQIYLTHWEGLVSGENLSGIRVGRKPGRPHRPAFENEIQKLITLPAYPRPTSSVTTLKVPLPSAPKAIRRQAVASSPDAPWQAINALQVEILWGKDRIASGCRWQNDSFVLTKASLIPEEHPTDLKARLSDGTEWDLAILGVDSHDDLALLRMTDATPPPLSPVPPAKLLEAGNMVVSLAQDFKPSVGFIASEPRHFNLRQPVPAAARPFLGVRSQLIDNRLTIIDIVNDSAAQRSGLQKGDEIVAVDQQKVLQPEELNRLIGSYTPGDQLTIEVRRDEALHPIQVQLGMQTSDNPRNTFDQWGGGPFSKRRFGFSSVLTHDTTLAPEYCGGPLVNAKGEWVGINIARALRVATYALTADRVDAIAQRLVNESSAAKSQD